MVDISKNKYLINESDNRILDENEKVTINIKLNIDRDRTGQVRGIVRDIKNQKLKGAKAKIISKDGEIFLNTESDENGEFYFNNIPENKECKIFITFPEKDNYESNWFKVVDFFEYKDLNFFLLDKKKYSIILGSLKIKSKNSLEGIEIALFIEDSDKNLTLRSIVRSNIKGEFMFSNLLPGNYVIKVENDETKYLTKKVNVLENNKIISILIEI